MALASCKIEFIRGPREAVAEAWSQPIPPLSLSLLLNLLAVGLLALIMPRPISWNVIPMFLVIGVPHAMRLLLVPVYYLFSGREKYLVQIDETGLTTTITKGTHLPPAMRHIPREQLIHKGVLVEDDLGLQISLQGGWSLRIPRTAVADDQKLDVFRIGLISQWKTVSPAKPLFELDVDSQIDGTGPAGPEQGWRWGFFRMGAVFILIQAGMQAGIKTGEFPKLSLNEILNPFLALAVAGTFLIVPRAIWESCERRWLNLHFRNWLEIYPDCIEMTPLPSGHSQVLCGHWSKFDLNDFGRSGEMTETSEGFLLEYPRQKNRIPSHRCWIPKQKFSFPAESDAFRELIQRKLGHSRPWMSFSVPPARLPA